MGIKGVSGGVKGIPGFVLGLIFIALAVVVANVILVYRSSQSQRHLVRTDYYAESLKHDTLVVAQRRADSLIHHLPMTMQLSLRDNQANVMWLLADSASRHLPEWATLEQSISHCEALFYRPDDRHLDYVLPLQSLSADAGSQGYEKQWQAETKVLKPGLWRVSVRWYAGQQLILARDFHHAG